MRGFVIGSLLLLAVPVFAQTEVPSAQQMVEQLKTAPRVRSLRNLTVEAVAPANNAATQVPAAPGSASDANSTPLQAPAGNASAMPTSGERIDPTDRTDSMEPVARPALSLSIQFDFDSSRIRPESLLALGNLAEALGSAALLPSKFVIEGHTDAKGSAEYNRRLSDQRAAAVRNLLVSKGIASARLQSVGKGASEPANPGAPLAPENRRVRIVNLD